jgi:CheY-like chemotaxis protein
MLNQFKYFSRPYSMAYVDDDRDFLELLAMALPGTWNGHYFSRTQGFIDFVRQSTLLSQRDFALLNKVFQAGNSIENPILNTLHYWRQNPQRWSICDLGVLDFSMPKMSGLEVLKELPSWQGLRVLLTGVADEKIAVLAFNQGLIHQFLPKQSDHVVGKLKAAVQGLNAQLHVPQQLLVQSQLNDEQLGMLRHESTAAELSAFAAEHWVEYIVLGNPFGVLGLQANGQVSWLQLERGSDIEDLKSIAANEAWDAVTLNAIRLGNVLSNSLLRQALGNAIAPAVAPVLALGTNDLIGAFFPFELPPALLASCSYQAWFASNSSRLIKD